MKRLIIISILVIISVSCMSAPKQNDVPIATSIAIELTRLATQNEPVQKESSQNSTASPHIATFPPPAVGAPTQMATVYNDVIVNSTPSPTNVHLESLSSPQSTAIVPEFKTQTIPSEIIVPAQNIPVEIIPPTQNAQLPPIMLSENVFIDPSVAEMTFPDPLTINNLGPEVVQTSNTDAPERSITFSVTGDAIVAEIFYTDSGGQPVDDIYTLPFEQTMSFKQGSPLLLNAKIISESGSITCEIRSEEKTMIQNSIQGFGGEANCTNVIVE